MAIDGFFIKNLILEFNEVLIGSRLEKIYQLDKDFFMFQFYYRGNRNKLIFKLSAPNSSVFLSDRIDGNNSFSSSFLNVLKKEIEGTILNSIDQYKTDRVLIFTFSKTDFLDGKIEYKLILELMGRHNNLILTRDNIIIDAYSKRFSETSRSILPNIEYNFFPTNKEVLTNLDYSTVGDPKYLSQNYMGISPLLSSYSYNNKFNFLEAKLEPTLNLDNYSFYWFDLFETNNKKKFSSLSNLLEEIVSIPKINNEKHKNFVENELIKLKRRKAVLEETKHQALINLSDKDKGDAIYASGKNLDSNLTTIVSYNGDIITLDSSISLNQNAQNFYKSYQKAKRTLEHVDKQQLEIKYLEKTFNEFRVFLSYSNNDDLLTIEEELKKYGFKARRKKQYKPKSIKDSIITIKYLDSYIYVGKNNTQNDYITNKLATKEDYWLHVKDAPGSHVLIKSSNINSEIINLAANLAAKYSDLRYSSNIGVNITKIKNVKTIKGLPGYNVSISNYETLYINIDEDLIRKVFIANNLNYQ